MTKIYNMLHTLPINSVVIPTLKSYVIFVTGLHVRSGGEDLRMTAETTPVAPPGGEAGHVKTFPYYDQEYARMEAWLDEHPDFVHDYFIRYVLLWCLYIL